MYRGKRYRRRKNKKPILLLVSMLLVFTVAVGGTLAYLVAQTDSVENTFTVQQVPIKIDETKNGNTKTSVTIKNISDKDNGANDSGTSAYIRAMVVANWTNAQNEVYAQAPVKAKNYNFKLGSDWVEGPHGYFYYKNPVDPDHSTDSLFDSDGCTLSNTNAPEGYQLSVEILAQSIQARGVNTNNKMAIEDAWDVVVTVDANGKILTIQ